MALKAVLTKAEYDALPEVVRSQYQEKDGKYNLQVEGGATAEELLALKNKVAEMRDTNIDVMKERDLLKTSVAKFEGIDPEEYKTLKDEVATLKKKGITKSDDIDAIVQKAIEKATKPIQDALTEERVKRESAQKLADDGKFRELVSAEATKAGVAPSAVRHVLREAEHTFELKDGNVVPREGKKHPTDPLKELTTGDWLASLAKTDGYLFEPSSGGGANGGNKPGDSAGKKRLINPSPEEMGKHAEDLASGKMIVVRQ